MKRILLTNFHPHRGGGGGHARYIQTLLQSDLRKDFEFGVAAPEGSAVWTASRALGVTTFACDYPGHFKEIPRMPGAVRRFERIAAEWRPDLVHANGSRDQNIVVLWKALYGRGVPCVRTHHAVRNIPDNAYNRWAYLKVIRGHLYVSHSAKNMSWVEPSLRPPNALVVPNGVDVNFWTPRAKDPASLQQLGLDAADFVFGSHAGMGAHKRTDLFLRGAALVKRRGPRRAFRILLRGNDQEVAQSRRLGSELGLDNLHYVQHAPDPRGYLSVIDVGFLLSEAIEAISFAARELMAMGKPLISSNYAGLVENVDDELNGRLVECGDAEGVAAAIDWFLALDAERLAELSRNARLKAERVFSVDKQIAALRGFYRASLGLSTSSV
ncbi:MAG TPA: glycosyltransferase family 4 protein [Burkholderiales bacterium]|nr:glycosyltransferase family 4 protein [Burkholderiales bacterium]